LPWPWDEMDGLHGMAVDGELKELLNSDPALYEVRRLLAARGKPVRGETPDDVAFLYAYSVAYGCGTPADVRAVDEVVHKLQRGEAAPGTHELGDLVWGIVERLPVPSGATRENRRWILFLLLHPYHALVEAELKRRGLEEGPA